MGKRLLFGIEIGGIMALLAIPCIVANLYWMKAFTPAVALVASTPASLSALLIAVAITLFKDLAGDLRLEAPMNLAFPIMFGIVNLTVARAMSFTPSVALSPNEVLNPVQIWFDAKMVILAFAVQVIVLTLACKPWVKPADQRDIAS